MLCKLWYALASKPSETFDKPNFSTRNLSKHMEIQHLEDEEEEEKHRGFGGWGPQDLPKPYKYQCFGSLEVENTHILMVFLVFLVLKFRNTHILMVFLVFLVLQGPEVQADREDLQSESPDLAKPKKTRKPLKYVCFWIL